MAHGFADERLEYIQPFLHGYVEAGTLPGYRARNIQADAGRDLSFYQFHGHHRHDNGGFTVLQ